MSIIQQFGGSGCAPGLPMEAMFNSEVQISGSIWQLAAMDGSIFVDNSCGCVLGSS